MKRSIVLLGVSACLVALLGVAVPARAQNFVTFVSDSGNDANTCTSIAEACREITGANGALAKTPNGGVIHVLPGEYVAFSVLLRSVDIIADNGQASIVNSAAGPIEAITGNAGIAIVVGAGDVVRIRGFIINADHGIAISSEGGIVYLEENTPIGGSSNRYGIIYSPASASELYVADSRIARENSTTGGGGILIKPRGSGSAKVVIGNVHVDDTTSGVTIDGRATTGVNSVTLRNSVVSGSNGYGVGVLDSGDGITNVDIEGSTIANNATTAVKVNGANATVRVSHSVITANATGLAVAGGGKLISNGGNVVRGNTANGVFTSTEPQQ
jgi:hypothetical protein